MELATPSVALPLATAVEMVQKPTALPFLGRRTVAPRPLSDATEIFDTDGEGEFDDPVPPWDAADNESESTVSSSQDEPATPPHTLGLDGFEFHFDDQAVVGPHGPHLFRRTPDILAHPDDDGGGGGGDDPFLPRFSLIDPAGVGVGVGAAKPLPAKPIMALNTAVAALDEAQVRHWTPAQVASWMAEAGFEPAVVDKFLIHDISGSVLIDLQFEDLKELDISSFGKRHRVMSSIQQLRNSSMITLDVPLSRTPSRSQRGPAVLQRPARPDERAVTLPARSRSSRRGRQHDVVTPAESISIVGIEHVLPQEHSCAKGESCPKWQKQQRRIRRLQHAFQEDCRRPLSGAPSEALPSVVGSSDVLGPSAMTITANNLRGVEPRDAQESVRQFLDFQHLIVTAPSASSSLPTSPPAPASASASASAPTPAPAPAADPTPAESTTHAAKSAHLAEHLRGLPKLTIPSTSTDHHSPLRTPISALQKPTQVQAQLRAQLQRDPYHYGGVASPADIFRLDTPFSVTDLPITALSVDPCQRDVSQSVPPEMRYGAAPSLADLVQRCTSVSPPTRRHARLPSFTPSVAPVLEHDGAGPPRRLERVSEIEFAHHQGWMRKRKTTRLRRHEWQDQYCTLVGSQLTLHDSHYANAAATEKIDVDGYQLHAYSQASSSKLGAAFKKSVLGQGRTPAAVHNFAFSLIPEDEASRKLFEKSKSHHFALDSSQERVEWMRKLMLAKAMKRNDPSQI